MNLTLNTLPTRTWNHLGMNETRVEVEEAFSSFVPEADYDAGQVLWQADGADAAFTGAPRGLLPVTEQAAHGFAETRPGVEMTRPLVLTYHYTDGRAAASRLTLHAAAGSRLKAVLVLQGEEDNTSAIRTEVYADADAAVELYVVQLLSAGAVCMNHIGGVCGDRAQLELTRLELGAGKLYAGAEINLDGRESSFRTEIGYHAVEDQLLDMNYAAYHRGKDSRSLMEVSGTLEENARKIFRGTIDFRKGCAGARGTEQENVLLIGDQMVNQTIPLILCAEEDVEGNHGASIGRLDEKVLFYLGSRGFTEEEARQMMARSRIEAVCERLPLEELRTLIHDFEQQRGMAHEPACEG